MTRDRFDEMASGTKHYTVEEMASLLRHLHRLAWKEGNRAGQESMRERNEELSALLEIALRSNERTKRVKKISVAFARLKAKP